MRSVLLIALFGLLALTSARLHSSHLAPAEDSDAALERAENNLSDQEFEEEEVPSKIRNVINDAHAVRRALEEAEMEDDVKEAAIEHANAIALEAEELVHATPAHARKLKQEMKQHMAHLKNIESRENHEQEEEDEESPAGRVVRDVAEVQAQIEADERLPAHKKAQASHILERMATHARNFPSASSSAKREIKSMLRSELEELKSVVGAEREMEEDSDAQFEEEAPIRNHQSRHELEEEKAAKVEGDVEEIKREIRHADLPSAVRKAANANLDAISRDAEEYPSASADRKHDLQKAMKLRVAALREQLGEN